MSKSNQKRNKQLGMTHGTACNKLRKSILFELTKRLEINFCHQCGEEITSVDELSIEHKIPWLDSEDPVLLFFDLDNIGFSHLNCNIRAGRKPNRKYETPEDRENSKNERKRQRRLEWSEEERARQAGLRRQQYLRTGK